MLRFPEHQISGVIEWVIEYAIFLHGLAQQWTLQTKIWHKGSLRDEDDARTLNTHIMQRKRAIPHSMMKNNCNIIECCNNIHQEAPHTGKQMCGCASDLDDASHVTCTVKDWIILLFHRVFTSTKTNCMKILKSTHEVLPVVNME